MIAIKIDEICRVTSGKILSQGKSRSITSICIDSRLAQKGSLFIAIKGENVDGHDYVEDAINRGAVAVLVERPVSFKEDTVILVQDNYVALHMLTSFYRSQLSIPIIALTGSSGKTTTKDIVASVLKQKFRVHKTNGNQNNDLGVPLTLFGIEEDTQIAVIEMGMNHLGEISTLVQMARPDISIITNVGVTHMEYLGTQENIFKAKCEILETLGKNQMALVNGDDPYLKTLNNREFQVKMFGTRENADLWAYDIESNASGLRFSINYKGKSQKYRFSYPGKHNVYNCMVGIFLGLHFDLTHEEIQKGLQEYSPSNHRMDIRNISGYTVINDSYNANPDAMKAALQVLIDYKQNTGKAIAVIGDMLEMGEDAIKYHFEIGEYIANGKEIDRIIAIGENAQYYKAGALHGGMKEDVVHYFTDKEKASKFLKNALEQNDVILLKGSRAMAMEEILHTLERSK